MKNLFVCLLCATVGTSAFAGVTADKLAGATDGKKVLETMCAAFAKTPVAELEGASEDVQAWLAAKNVKGNNLAKIARVVYANVEKTAIDEKDRRLTAVERCYSSSATLPEALPEKKATATAAAKNAAEPLPVVAPEYVKRGASGRFRLLIGTTYETGLEASGKNGKADDGGFGVSIDAMENFVESDYWNLWLGMGLSYLPRHKLGTARSGYTTNIGTVYEENFEYKASMLEWRMMLNPEWRVTEYWTIGALVGVSIDRSAMNVRERASATNAAFPFLNNAKSASTTEKDLYFSGLFGLQTTCRFTKHFGVYANVIYRTVHDLKGDSVLTGARHKLEVGGMNYGAGLFSEF